jgi:hypothetical protein
MENNEIQAVIANKSTKSLVYHNSINREKCSLFPIWMTLVCLEWIHHSKLVKTLTSWIFKSTLILQVASNLHDLEWRFDRRFCYHSVLKAIDRFASISYEKVSFKIAQKRPASKFGAKSWGVFPVYCSQWANYEFPAWSRQRTKPVAWWRPFKKH